MTTHLYLSMIPEALVASMLPPKDFGAYLAVGSHKRTQGQAIFFDLKDGFKSDHFDLSKVAERCVPHADGQPKHSVYLSIYRVLEHVPLEAVNSLWLVTRDGRILELQQGPVPGNIPGKFHLYQEVCPCHPLIVSSLEPNAFRLFITRPSQPISVPRICFVEIDLAGLAENPEHGEAGNLPYSHLEHLRDCLAQLRKGSRKHTKTVDRIQPQDFPYRCTKSGFFLGDQEEILYYPFPSGKDFEGIYHDWWRSVSV